MNKRDFLRNLGASTLWFIGLPFIKSRKAEAGPAPFEFAQTPEPDPARFIRMVSTMKDLSAGKFKIEACSDPDQDDWHEVNVFGQSNVYGVDIDCDVTVDLHTGTIQVFDHNGNPRGPVIPL